MKIHNPSNLPVIDYRTVLPLQGELKDLSKENYQKLKRVLEKRGFTVPLFLWHTEDKWYLLDGHQRFRVMMTDHLNDDGSYEVPYVEIIAKNEADAKEQLLEITSQYGTITYEGYDEFVANLNEADLLEVVSFDALPLLGDKGFDPVSAEDQPELDKKKLLKCPKCEYEDVRSKFEY